MFDKLNAVESRYDELVTLLADPAVQNDTDEVPQARQGAVGDSSRSSTRTASTSASTGRRRDAQELVRSGDAEMARARAARS